METLRAVASFAGSVIGLVSLVAAFIYYRRTRRFKALTYEIFPTLSLVQVGSEIKDKVKVEYDGERIDNLSGVSVEIRSSGTEPVEFNRDTDAHALETPVTLDFGSETRILGEPAVAAKPEDLTVSARKDLENPSRILLDKFLLNPGQSVTVSAFADDLRQSPRACYELG